MYTHANQSKNKKTSSHKELNNNQEQCLERPHILLSAFECLHTGSLDCSLPGGLKKFYRGLGPGPKADITIHDWRVLDRLVAESDVGFGEDYIFGLWDSNDLTALLQLLLENLGVLESFVYGQGLYKRVSSLLKAKFRANTLKGSRKNIECHYDLGNEFYSLWLDETFTYSSALFDGCDRSLVEAQRAKYQRILDKLEVRPGDRLLEVGCGWGGFLEHVATHTENVRATGLTISQEQYDFASRRLQEKDCGLATVRLQDYREVGEQYDHVVSIGMFEHVGEEFWSTYMEKIHECLKVGGKAVIQSINIADHLFDRYRQHKDFMQAYIFPGGMLPTPRCFCEEARKAGLAVKEVFQFGQDYARTIHHWHREFLAARDQVLQLGFDERFIRKWRFYLSGCEAAFRTGRTSVMQVLVEKSRVSSL